MKVALIPIRKLLQIRGVSFIWRHIVQKKINLLYLQLYSILLVTNGEPNQENLFLGDNETEEEDESDPEDVIIVYMDIREPVQMLRTILEQKIGVSLKNYEIWLQDAQELESHKNLVDQCVQGEGLVQINVQVQTMTNRINIVDVLKPNEDVLTTNPEGEITTDGSEVDNYVERVDEEISSEKEKDNSPIIRWVVDNHFKRDQARLKIPDDPIEWTCAQVKHWLQWAVRQFNLSHIKLSDWTISGVELCNITLTDFQIKVPNDPGDIFWTHLELLRKCKFVAIIQKTNPDEIASDDIEAPAILRRTNKTTIGKTKILKTVTPLSSIETYYTSGNRTGNNGQIQLWQFLLEILTDREYRNIIYWMMGGNGEFKLNDPERVAQLWGERKNKPTMNYEKLSRALRYYYDGDMISKVHGKRFV